MSGILCKRSLEEFIDQYYLGQKNNAQVQRCSIIFVDNPRAAFIKIINKIYNKDKKNVGVSPTTIISATASIGSDCYIGNNVVIGDDCKIGNSTAIYDRVVLVQKCVLGNNCIIEPGVTLSADGFAYEREPRSLHVGQDLIVH
jgi:UDP-3-O-[3-hydroxymyristoyl] glucosamine N-acyltransferase